MKKKKTRKNKKKEKNPSKMKGGFPPENRKKFSEAA